jgi:hypothetical protein
MDSNEKSRFNEWQKTTEGSNSDSIQNDAQMEVKPTQDTNTTVQKMINYPELLWCTAISDENKLYLTILREDLGKSRVKDLTETSVLQVEISTSSSDNLFIVLSGALGYEVVPKIATDEKIRGIYIFCFKVEEHKIWTSKFPIIKQVEKDFFILRDKLLQDIRKLEEELKK